MAPIPALRVSGSTVLEFEDDSRTRRIVHFTQKMVDRLPPSDERERLTDSSLSGLTLRLEPSGKHTWWVRLPSRKGVRQRWIKIGLVSDWPVKRARAEAHRIRQEASTGADAGQALEIAAAQKLPFEELAQIWIDEDVSAKKQGTLDSYEEKLALYILPAFQGKRLKELSTDVIRKWHEGITQQGVRFVRKEKTGVSRPAATAADRALGTLKSFFAFALVKKWITENPTRDVPVNGDHKIHRPMDSNARRKVGTTIQEMLVDGSANAIYLMAVQLSLATSIRRDSLTSLEWAEVLVDQRIFRLVDKRTSHLNPQILPMGPMAYSILKCIPRIADSPYVFPGRDPMKPMAPGTLNAVWNKVRERAGVFGEYPEQDRYGNPIENPKIRPHDLRHTKTAKLGETEELPMIGAVVGIKTTETLNRYKTPVKKEVAKVNTDLEDEFAEDLGVAIDPEFYADGSEPLIPAPVPVQIVVQFESWPQVGKRKSKKPVEEATKPPRVRRTKANYPPDEELQPMVLERPVSAVARDLGVSAKALEKYCKARGIEVRTRGYWAQQRARGK